MLCARPEDRHAAINGIFTMRFFQVHRNIGPQNMTVLAHSESLSRCSLNDKELISLDIIRAKNIIADGSYFFDCRIKACNKFNRLNDTDADRSE
jgi:hypothetical protein